MTGAYANVSALEHQIILESLRRVSILRPFLAMLMAEALAADDIELAALVPAALDVEGGVICAADGVPGIKRGPTFRLAGGDTFQIQALPPIEFHFSHVRISCAKFHGNPAVRKALALMAGKIRRGEVQ